jgi:hypothetical protein
MNLYCKEGEYAQIIISQAGNAGKVVKCVKFVGMKFIPGMQLHHDLWEIDQSLPTKEGKTTMYFKDSWMRPMESYNKKQVEEIKEVKV